MNHFQPSEERPFSKPLAIVMLLLAVLVFSAHVRHYGELIEDDAYISWRYARNVAAGHGFVFNEGERVEGYSNFLWVWIAAAGIRSGIDPIHLGKILGLLSGLSCLLLSAWLAARMMSPVRLTFLLAPFYLAISPVLVHHSIAGLESSFFALLLSVSVLLGAQPWHRVDKAPRISMVNRVALALVLVALCMTRPEAPLLAGLILATRWFLAGSFRAVALEWVVYLGLFAVYFVWRWTYFDVVLPNTFFAKVRGGLDGVIQGTRYTLDFLRDGGGVFFVGAALVPIVVSKVRPLYGLTLIVVLAYVSFIVVVGGDWMYNYRFFAHVLPLITALIAMGFETILSLGMNSRFKAITLHVLGAVLFVATLAAVGNTEFRVARLILPALESHNYLSQNYQELGQWFAENTDEEATIAVSDVGAIGYYSERRILDMFGLVDPHVARLHGRMHWKADARYILAQEPDYVVLLSFGDEGRGTSFHRIPDYNLNVLPQFHEEYERIRTVPQNWNNEFALIYRRRSQS